MRGVFFGGGCWEEFWDFGGGRLSRWIYIIIDALFLYIITILLSDIIEA